MLPLAMLTAMALLFYIFHRKKYRFAQNIPSIDPWHPGIGNGMMFIGKSPEDRFRNFVGAFQQSDRLFQLWFGPKLTLGTCHPDLIQKITHNPDCIERPLFFYKLLRMTKGLLVARHALWKSQRKVLNPTFNLRILHSFIPIFVDCCKQMMERLEQRSKEEVVNLYELVSQCTLEMVCGTTLGAEHLREASGSKFLQNIERVMEIMGERILSLHLQIGFVYIFTPTFWREMYSLMMNQRYAAEIIAVRRQKLTIAGSQKTAEDDQDGSRKPQIFLDQILSTNRAGITFDDEEIQHNVRTLIAAGNDTSALAISHCCLWLAMYPDIQERVYQEIQAIYPDADMDITPDGLKKLPFTEMCIKETLRLSGPAPNIARETLADIELDGVTIPRGTVIILCLYAMHRRRDLWGPMADCFDPDNFNEENCRHRAPGAFIPFSSGPRDCIGGRYAMISMKIMLIFILKHFKLTTRIQPDQLRYRFGPTLKLAFDHWIRLEKRIA